MDNNRAGVPAVRQSTRVRQSDIARAAGVSQATVSLVLNKAADVSIGADTRQAVLDAARSLGYVPDPVARRLATGRNCLLGLHTFMPTFPVDVADSYYPYLAGVEEEAAAQGFDLILFTGSTGKAARESALHRLPLSDGCVLVGRHLPVLEVQTLLESGFPLVYLGRHDELGTRLPYVGADYVGATEDLVDRLWAMGHRRLLYVQETDPATASTDRETGFLRGVHKHGADTRGFSMRIDSSEITPEVVRQWVDQKYSAILVEGGTESLMALQALAGSIEKLGLRVPQDLSLAMTGQQLSYSFGERTITGFDVPRREMGRQAVRMLIDLLSAQNLKNGNRQLLLDCVPVDGDTAGPPDAAFGVGSSPVTDGWKEHARRTPRDA